MFPILWRWNGVTLHTYGLFVALGFLLGYAFSMKNAARHGYSPAVIADGAWTALIGGLLGARILYIAFQWPMYAAAPLDVFKIWQGGLVWYGGLIFGFLAFYGWLRWKKEPLLPWVDLITPGMALGHGFGRLGCFFAGCCYGKPCALPWAVTFRNTDSLAPLGTPLHPSQIYESALTLALAAVLIRLSRKDTARPGSGRIFSIYLLGYGLLRFLVEFTRDDDRGPRALGLTSTQWVSLGLVAAGLFVSFYLRRQPHAESR
jgi:phosphatidylglycerol:prolipoprotein diacylglycerol transferase